MKKKAMTARILCIGGSDSSGGAGLQADLKTIVMLGGYGMTAITALTAQNTIGVAAVHVMSPGFVIAQIDAVIADIGVDAIKIGMIGTADIAEAVAARVAALCAEGRDIPVILDPVMIATSGAVLADAATVRALHRLMANATLVTPNLPELDALGGEGALSAAGHLIVIKGGHAAGHTIIDRLVGPNGEIARWSDSRINTRHTHGTGCTLASAIACGLGQGMPMEDAIARARAFVRSALRQAPGFGVKRGPLGHHAVVTMPLLPS